MKLIEIIPSGPLPRHSPNDIKDNGTKSGFGASMREAASRSPESETLFGNFTSHGKDRVCSISLRSRCPRCGLPSVSLRLAAKILQTRDHLLSESRPQQPQGILRGWNRATPRDNVNRKRSWSRTERGHERWIFRSISAGEKAEG